MADSAKVYIAPEGESMNRAANPFLLDPLGYARITRLQPNSCRIKCYNGLVCARMIGVCLLEKILPQIPEPTIIQPINEGWDAAKEIDGIVQNITSAVGADCSPLQTGGDWTDGTFKLLLCIPCFEKTPTAFIFEGQAEHTLTSGSVKEQVTEPKINVSEKLFITDERSMCNRCCGCKKGRFTIYKGNEKIAETKKSQPMCGCASYYKMVDNDGVVLARIQVSPTFCECLNRTCRKFTCQCCCICRVCDCIRCKCCASKPWMRIQAPSRKEEMMVFNKAKCCKAPKGKVMFPTLYVPGENGGDAPDEKEDEDTEEVAIPDAAEAAKDALALAGADKYNKQSKGPEKGQPGKKVKYYMKKPPYCCVQFKRDMAKAMCMEALGEMGIDGEALAGKMEGDVTGGAAAPEDPRMKNYKRASLDSKDMQFGSSFTTSQKAGALLVWLWDVKGMAF
jgi:hypothetical protein